MRSVIVGVQRACRGHSVKKQLGKATEVWVAAAGTAAQEHKRRAVAGRNGACTPLRPADRPRDPTGCTRVLFSRSAFLPFELAVLRVHMQSSANKRKIRVVNTDFMTCSKSCFYL